MLMLRYLLPALLLLLCALSSSAAGIALLLQVEGKASVRALGAATEPAQAPRYLTIGTEIQVAGGSQVTLLHLGRQSEIVLTGPVLATLSRSGVMAAAKRVQESPLPAEPLLAQSLPRSALMPASPAAQPADGSRLLPGWRRFSWPGSQPQTFTLQDASGQTLFSQPLARSPLQLPENQALQAGRGYRWAVQAPDASTPPRWHGLQIADAGVAQPLLAQRPTSKTPAWPWLFYQQRLRTAGFSTDADALWAELNSP